MAKYDPTSTARGRELQPRAGDAYAVIHVPTSAIYYEAAIEGLTRMNEEILSSSAFPRIYESGVGYRKEDVDTWRHADDVLCSGWGDCEDLSAWRAAELRVTGEDPDARVYVYRSGPMRFHAVVARGDGRLEDPSIKLGMKVSEARRAQLPKWEGDAEMSDVTPRTFGACANTCGEDILSRGTVGEDGALLTDPPGTSGFFSSLRNAAGRAAGGMARQAFRPFGSGARMLRSSVPPFPGVPRMFPGVRGFDDGSGASDVGSLEDQQDEMLLGIDDGVGAYYEDDPAGDGGMWMDDGSMQYADEYPQEEYPQEEYPQEQAPQGPNPIEQAAAAAGRGIKSAASSAWDTTKDVFLPIKYGVQTAVAPIKMVKNVSQKAAKYLQAPVKAINKVFSFLGGVDEVMPEQVGLVDDEDYAPGDEFWGLPGDGYDGDGGGDEESFASPPASQKPRFRTEEVSPGIWQGQVILPTKEPGKAFTLTTTPAPDEQSAGDRMYNLALHAANTPAMMALTNPLAFAVLMTMKGTSKIPFGSAFKAIGSGVSTAARAVGRGAESIAQAATSW